MLVLVDCDFMIYYCYICIIFEKILYARRVYLRMGIDTGVEAEGWTGILMGS